MQKESIRVSHPLLFLTLVLTACGAESKPPLPAPADGEGVQLQMLSTLEPGKETERCKFFVVPEGGWYVNRASVRYTAGSHHVLLFTTSYTSVPTVNRQGQTVDTADVFECSEGAAGEWDVAGVAGGAQSSDAPDIIDLPTGIAIKLEAGTVLIMNTHYLNASPRPLETDARINLYTVAKETVTEEAGVLFFYNPFIRVPAMGTATARMSCPVTRDITLFNGQSHMHRRGIGQVANLVDHATGDVLEELYRSDDWENVFVKNYSPGKALAKGTAIDYRCNYDNKEDRVVTQGFTTKDEMCMFIGSYYPRDRALELCATSPDINTSSGAATYIGSGDSTCLETLLCVRNAKGVQEDKGDSLYGCIVNSCEKAAPALSEYFRCSLTKGDMACMTELNTCVATSCD